MGDCICGQLMLGNTATSGRNWDANCPEHGLDSDWFRSPGQVLKRRADDERLRDLQSRAAAARMVDGNA